MALKYCRFCNAPLGVGENVPSVGDFCSDDHRRQYQDKIQRETIERLRRAESRPQPADSAGAPPAPVRSTLQPGLPPNLIPTPPLQSTARASVSHSAVAFAIQPETEPELETVIETHPIPVESALAELSKVAELSRAAEPVTAPPSGPIQKTDNAALSSILRQAKGRIASDPAAQTTALALRRRPRPVAKAAPPAPPAAPAAAAPPSAPPSVPPSVATPARSAPPAPPPVPAMAPAARSPITVRAVQIVEDPEPATAPVTPAVSAPRPSPAVKPQPQATFTPVRTPTMTSSDIQLDVAPPSLTFAPTEQSFFARMPWFAKLGLVLALAAAGGGAYWQMEKSAATTRSAAKPVEERLVPLAVLASGWVNTPAEGAEAVKQGRILTVYKPSLELTDYRVEFTGEIAHRAMGWVYRMKSPSNYHAAKLHLNPVAKVRLSLVRWTVKNGVAGEKVWVPIDGPLPSNGRYVVRIDVKGDTFVTRVQGRLADRFTDSTFDKGGFAYANENTERGKVEVTSIDLIGKPSASGR